MTLQECTAILTPLALALRADLDEPSFRAYHRVLQDLSGPLLQAAADTASQQPERHFFPTAPELTQLAARCRQALEAAHPWEGCAECDMQKGWRTVLVDGIARAERCPCKARHAERIARYLHEGPIPLGLQESPVIAESPKQLTEVTVDPEVLARIRAIGERLQMPEVEAQTDPKGQPVEP